MSRNSNFPGFAVESSLTAFLGALGFIPGWEPLFGFTGFFGLVGVAHIIEAVARLRSRAA